MPVLPARSSCAGLRRNSVYRLSQHMVITFAGVLWQVINALEHRICYILKTRYGLVPHLQHI